MCAHLWIELVLTFALSVPAQVTMPLERAGIAVNRPVALAGIFIVCTYRNLYSLHLPRTTSYLTPLLSAGDLFAGDYEACLKC